jgi:streptogramin lyase
LRIHIWKWDAENSLKDFNKGCNVQIATNHFTMGIVLLFLVGCSGSGTPADHALPETANSISSDASGTIASAALQSSRVPITASYRLALRSSPKTSYYRNLEYVSGSNTQITVKVTPLGGSSASYGPSACTSFICIISFTAGLGPNNLVFTLSDGTNTLSSFSTTQIVQPSGLNTFNFTANPIVDHVSLSLASSTENVGSPVDDLLTVNAFDKDNNLIVGSIPYLDSAGSPVTLSLNSTNTQAGGLGTVTITGVPQLTAANQGPVYAHYDGNWLQQAALSVTSSSPVITGLAGTTLTPNPKLTEYLLSNRSFSITTGPDGNLWCAETNGNRIARITPSGSVTEFTIPTASSTPYGITTGPDGNLWFTEHNAAQVGRITPSGVITEYTTPTGMSSPYAITAGPDGNVWFTEAATNKVSRITPSGKITEFSVPTSGANPLGIVAGPDGNLWISETQTNKIEKLTRDGISTEYIIPTANTSPEGVAVGPDGNIWFAEYSQSKIGRITINGSITEYALPTSGSSPENITAGPDGNLWFTEYTKKSLGKITPGGVITEYNVIPSASNGSIGITLGSDGNIWLTENNLSGQIAKFIL